MITLPLQGGTTFVLKQTPENDSQSIACHVEKVGGPSVAGSFPQFSLLIEPCEDGPGFRLSIASSPKPSFTSPAPQAQHSPQIAGLSHVRPEDVFAPDPNVAGPSSLNQRANLPTFMPSQDQIMVSSSNSSSYANTAIPPHPSSSLPHMAPPLSQQTTASPFDFSPTDMDTLGASWESEFNLLTQMLKSSEAEGSSSGMSTPFNPFPAKESFSSSSSSSQHLPTSNDDLSVPDYDNVMDVNMMDFCNDDTGSSSTSRTSTDEPASSPPSSEFSTSSSQKSGRSENVFHCREPGCNGTFTRAYTREVHERKHSKEQLQRRECRFPNCRARISRPHDRLRHEVTTHNIVADWTCICAAFFLTKNGLTTHQKSCERWRASQGEDISSTEGSDSQDGLSSSAKSHRWVRGYGKRKSGQT